MESRRPCGSKDRGSNRSRLIERSSSCLTTAAPDGLIIKCTWRPAATSTSSSRVAYTAPLAPVMASARGSSAGSLFADIERRDPKRQRPILDVLQSHAPHPLGEQLAIRELGNGCRQVLISRRTVAGQELPDARQDVAKVKQVN